MKEYYVDNFAELHDVLAPFRKSNRWVFRGQVDPEWNLLPRAGRTPYNETDDLAILEAWKRRAIEYLKSQPDNQWDWLTIAQHHGLATRLLDWSYNPLIAAYFAVTHKHNLRSHIFCYYPASYLVPEKANPSEYKGVSLFKPKGAIPRITRQGGVFTVHGIPTTSLENSLNDGDILELIVISERYTKELLHELNHYGINSSTVFPDLDGLSNYVNWHTENAMYWLVNADY